jgi:hypothetical protein
MKSKLVRVALLSLFWISAKAGTVVLQDSFTGSAPDSTNWTVSNPYGDSSVTVAVGVVTSANRGYLVSKAAFTGPLQIDTAISLSGNRTSANIVWKTDGNHPAGSATPNSGLSLGIYHESQSIVLAVIGGGYSQVFLPIPLEKFLTFRIEDTGTNISAYMNGSTTPTISLAYNPSSVGTNGAIDFYSRESAYTGGPVKATMDYITVTSLVVAPPPPDYPAQIAALEKKLKDCDDLIASLQTQLAAANTSNGQLSTANANLTQQVAGLQTQATAANATITQLTTANANLTQQVAGLQTQLTAATAQLTNANALLLASTPQLSAANAQLTAIKVTVVSLGLNLGIASKNPSFVIPGSTLAQQISNLAVAIGKLDKDCKKDLFENLGGVKHDDDDKESKDH